MNLSEYIQSVRERAKKHSEKAGEDTARLCKLNNLTIYENASVVLPPDKTQRTRRLIYRIIDGEDQP